MPAAAKLFQLLSDSAFRRALFRHRVAAAVELRPLLQDGTYGTIIDVGANRGQFTLLARKLFPHCVIIAFEPLPSEARIFRKVHERDSGTILHLAAAAPNFGTGLMHISRRTDSSSLLSIGPNQVSVFPDTQEIGTTQVQLVRLDDAIADSIRRPCLLKLDVQGFELSALEGADRILRSIDAVLLEMSLLPLYEGQPVAQDVTSWLNQRGFRMKMMGAPTMRSGAIVQLDALFVR